MVAKFGQCFSGSHEKNVAFAALTTSVSGYVWAMYRMTEASSIGSQHTGPMRGGGFVLRSAATRSSPTRHEGTRLARCALDRRARARDSLRRTPRVRAASVAAFCLSTSRAIPWFGLAATDRLH